MPKRLLLAVVLHGCAASLVLGGQTRKKAITKVLAVKDPDFALQGEYVGTIVTRDGKKRIGVQVIALGKGTFRAVVYQGGLPGAGWDGSSKVSLQGTRQGKGPKALFGDPATEAWKIEGTNMVKLVKGREAATLRKIRRSSPTLGLKPPPGAIVLFDGTSAENFVRGRMDPQGLLMQGTESKHKFAGDHIIHIEFRIPFMPERRGQGRGNSGVYLQARYEVQVLDSFGLEGRNNECGGIYGVAAPRVNMCFPPMSWQTYDVQLKGARFAAGGKTANARMTVYHNGVLVHDDVEIPKAWTTAAPRAYHDEHLPGPLYLQHHGSPARYRNIWAIELTPESTLSVKDIVKKAKQQKVTRVLKALKLSPKKSRRIKQVLKKK